MLLTVLQLAEALQVSDDTVYRKAAAGEIPNYRVGRQLRFRLEEVLEA